VVVVSMGFTQYFSSARKATAAQRSLGDLLRVAFSGLCVISYANWIKNESHFTIPYLCLCFVIFRGLFSGHALPKLGLVLLA